MSTAGTEPVTAATQALRAAAARGTGILAASDELDDPRDCDRVPVVVTAECGNGWDDRELVPAMGGLT
ncbi:hypothetical protein GPX89_43340 [Nocardia sp. ET3-3]|uniref:Uncharacterized protein n=1 Tax=Nocardia terrae TaxID=2675851 RepID=A0A7K1VCC2_9NOCA|nr:hypothetical protein [Nocardia terrae]MVU84052.1 hypothetical protein [Nocardia terrae]